MPFAAALSEHPVTAHAVGEAAGAVLEQLDGPPDVAGLFLTPPHAGALEDAAGAVAAILQPAALIGCAAVAAVGNAREVERGPAVSLWAGQWGAPATAFRLVARDDGSVVGWPPDLTSAPAAVVVLSDPFSLPLATLLEAGARTLPGVPIVGGHASVARGPGGNRLAVDTSVHTDGAVAVLLPAASGAAPVVSQGCRPIGDPYTVTRADGRLVFELGGRPAMERLRSIATQQLPPEDLALVNRGHLRLGTVVDEHRVEFGPGDFLILDVAGSEPATGAIAVSQPVPLGATVQFHLHDALGAEEEWRMLLGRRRASAALVFSDHQRGRALFGTDDHDAGALADAFGPAPVGGCFTVGVAGPVGPANHAHTGGVAAVLFADRS